MCIMSGGLEGKAEFLAWPVASSCVRGSERHLASVGAVGIGELAPQGALLGHEQ